MNIKVHLGSDFFDSYENVTRYKTGGTYDRTLHIFRGKELIAVYNTSSWTKVVKADEHDHGELHELRRAGHPA